MIIAAIAIPNLLRAKISANESAAMSTMRVINTAQVTYSTTYPAQGYARDLATLGSGQSGDCNARGTAEHACLLDNVLGGANCMSGAWCQKGPYRFTVSTDCEASNPGAQQQGEGAACAEYVAAATPVSSGTGRHSYCSVSDAVIRSRLGGPMDRPPTAEECKEWAPL